MKKQTLLIIIVIVFLVAIPVCWFGLTLGNPLSEYLAKRKAEKILSTGKYGNGYAVDEVYYQINDANYVVKIENKQKPDSKFEMIFDSWGKCYFVCYPD